MGDGIRYDFYRGDMPRDDTMTLSLTLNETYECSIWYLDTEYSVATSSIELRGDVVWDAHDDNVHSECKNSNTSLPWTPFKGLSGKYSTMVHTWP